MRRALVTIVIAVAACLGSPARAAYVIELVPSGTAEIRQGGTSAFTVTALNTGTTAIEIGQLDLGIQLLADGSPTGELAVFAFAPALTNSPWFDPAVTAPSLSTLDNGPVNGTAAYYLMSITEGDLDNVGSIPVGESRNLGSITLTATNDALGTWRLFFVSETNELDLPLTSITTPQFETVAFANLFASAYPAAGTALEAGTFVAVPEPATATLLASAAVLAVAASRRRRRAA